MKLKTHRFVVSCLLFCIVLTALSPLVSASELKSTISPNTEDYHEAMVDFESRLKLASLEKDVLLYMLSQMKVLNDFSGNVYILAEYSPYGFAIFHPASNLYVEYSPETLSSYFGLDGKLYYCGLMEYYYELNGEIKHTITKDVI